MEATLNGHAPGSNGTVALLEQREAYSEPLIAKPTRAGVLEQITVLVDRMGLDLSQNVPDAVKLELGTRTGAPPRTVRWALEQIKSERGLIRPRAKRPAGSGGVPEKSLEGRVLAELHKLGFELADSLPRGTVQAIAVRLGVKATAAQGALSRLRDQARKGDQPTLPIPPTSEPEAPEFDMANSPAPAPAVAAPVSPAPPVEDARSVVLKLAGKLVETNDHDTHLRLLSLLEKTL